MKILDVGCGVGMSTRAIKKHFPTSHVIGLDTSPEMLRIAKLVTRTNALKSSNPTTFSHSHFLRGNGEKTLFPDDTFDIVTIMYAFHEVSATVSFIAPQPFRERLTPLL